MQSGSNENIDIQLSNENYKQQAVSHSVLQPNNEANNKLSQVPKSERESVIKDQKEKVFNQDNDINDKDNEAKENEEKSANHTSTYVTNVQSGQSDPDLEDHSTFEEFSGHKFQPIDKEKEDELTHIQWTLYWRIGFVFCVLALLWWIFGMIAAISDHTKMPFCDTTKPLYYSCSVMSQKQAYSLCDDYCTNDPCWIKLQDTDDGILWDITVDGEKYAWIVNGWCADYNNESSAMFYCRIVFLIILLLWCFKVLKQIWKGIELPPLEREKVTGFKMILKMPERMNDKLYDLRINLRPLVQKFHNSSNKIADKFYNSEQHFINIMWSGVLLLFTMQFFLLELPVNILNLCSTTIMLQIIGVMELIKDVYFLIKMTQWRIRGRMFSEKQQKKVIEGMTKRYPESNIEFAYFYHFLFGFGLIKVVAILFVLMFSYFVLPVSNFDGWMRAINIFKNVYQLFNVLIKVFRLYFIVSSSFCCKITVSKRESLLIKDILKLFLVWTIFKIEVKDDDHFVSVDKNRGSAETIVYEYNSISGLTMLLPMSFWWGLGCYFTLGNGKWELSAFQDVRF